MFVIELTLIKNRHLRREFERGITRAIFFVHNFVDRFTLRISL